MPRKLIKKYLPDESSLRENKHLSWLGSSLHNPSLWHLTRKSVSRAFLVGIFCAFLPIPFQMVVAALIALFVRSNIPISVGLVWLTNPLTIPPVFYFTYLVGSYLMSTPPLDIDFNLEELPHILELIWWPLLTGSLFCGVLLGISCSVLASYLWVWHVRRTWARRHIKVP